MTPLRSLKGGWPLRTALRLAWDSGSMAGQPEPGERLERLIADRKLSSVDRALFLAHLEKELLREGSLDELRELRAYQARLNAQASRSPSSSS